MKTILAWHFAKSDFKTRYSDEAIAEGTILSATGDLELCSNGLHASENILDALLYAPGPVLSRVKLSEDCLFGEDKLCARNRQHLKVVDITPQLQEFTLLCAEHVLAVFEKEYPDDRRPRIVLETVKKFLKGAATIEELYKARQDAYDIRDYTTAGAYAYYVTCYISNTYAIRDVHAVCAVYATYAVYAYGVANAEEECKWQEKTLLDLIKPLFE